MDNKTIAFTLPISCHVCLGKVKQPVVCPNNHVFCKLCLEVWLQRVPACPTCRTPINKDQPFKSILGSQSEEKPSDQRWDLLRARIEISLKEYQEELDAQKTRNETLENENKTLLEKLASHVSTSKENESSVADFTVLNDELKRINTMYEDVKKENAELKKSNRSLTDQNVHLVRETELLRTEISKRSPQKFSRITVATLQNKLDDSEKKVKQLQKALEKTDEYVSELQSKMKHCKCSSKVDDFVCSKSSEREHKTSGPTKITCQRNLLTSLERDHLTSNFERSQGNISTTNEKSQTISTDNNDQSRKITTGKSDGLVTNSAQIAAIRAASCRMQNGRSEGSKDNVVPSTASVSSASSSSIISSTNSSSKNSQFQFSSPSTLDLNRRHLVTSDKAMSSADRQTKMATSPTKMAHSNKMTTSPTKMAHYNKMATSPTKRMRLTDDNRR